MKDMLFKNLSWWWDYVFLSGGILKSTLTDMKNRPVFTLNRQGEQAGFSAFIPTKSGPG
jgi:hypothetical protein